MKPEDYAVLTKHLRAKMGGRNFLCPVCGSSSWGADGPVASLKYAELSAGPAQVGGGAIPIVLLVCQTCSYTCQFAWLPIQAAHNG